MCDSLVAGVSLPLLERNCPKRSISRVIWAVCPSRACGASSPPVCAAGWACKRARQGVHEQVAPCDRAALTCLRCRYIASSGRSVALCQYRRVLRESCRTISIFATHLCVQETQTTSVLVILRQAALLCLVFSCYPITLVY